MNTPLENLSAFTVVAHGGGSRYQATLEDASGVALGTVDAAGVIRDATGTAAWHAPIDAPRRRDQPTAARLTIREAAGEELGRGTVEKYGIGPRSRHLTMPIIDGSGAEIGRIARSGDDRARLSIIVDGAEVGSVTVGTRKLGFLRKARTYDVRTQPDLSGNVRQLVVPAAIRYDALLAVVADAAARD